MSKELIAQMEGEILKLTQLNPCNAGMYAASKRKLDKEADKRRAEFAKLPMAAQYEGINNLLANDIFANIHSKLENAQKLFPRDPKAAKEAQENACLEVHNRIAWYEVALKTLNKVPIKQEKQVTIDYSNPVSVHKGLRDVVKLMCPGGHMTRKKQIPDAQIQAFKNLSATLQEHATELGFGKSAANDLFAGLLLTNCGSGVFRPAHKEGDIIIERTDAQVLGTLKDFEAKLKAFDPTFKQSVIDAHLLREADKTQIRADLWHDMQIKTQMACKGGDIKAAETAEAKFLAHSPQDEWRLGAIRLQHCGSTLPVRETQKASKWTVDVATRKFLNVAKDACNGTGNPHEKNMVRGADEALVRRFRLAEYGLNQAVKRDLGYNVEQMGDLIHGLSVQVCPKIISNESRQGEAKKIIADFEAKMPKSFKVNLIEHLKKNNMSKAKAKKEISPQLVAYQQMFRAKRAACPFNLPTQETVQKAANLEQLFLANHQDKAKAKAIVQKAQDQACQLPKTPFGQLRRTIVASCDGSAALKAKAKIDIEAYLQEHLRKANDRVAQIRITCK